MKLKEFLLKKTKARELCIITDCDYIIGATYIDNEDLFISSLNDNLLEKIIKSDHYETFICINNKNEKQEIIAHYISIF